MNIRDAWAELTDRAWHPHGSGHINDTFITDDGRYLLQRINRTVFPNAEGVMRNSAKVLAHVGPGYLIAPVPTVSGALYTVDENDDVWRLYPFAVGTQSFDRLPARLRFEAGRAFGRFARDLVDFDQTLETAIDGFHDLRGYLAALTAAADHPASSVDRAAVQDDVDFALAYPGAVFGDTERVIHGDCKVNNLLFESGGDRVAFVVDLDTVMTGHPAWDFGDLVRSAAAGAEESDGGADLDLGAFRDLARGYRLGLGEALDVDAFAAAPSHMSFMLGVRFLTDHLRGDRYFKVAHPMQNLERARAQFALTRRLDALVNQMKSVLSDV